MNLRLFEHLSEEDRAIAMAHPDYGSITIDWIIHLLPAHQIHHLKPLEQL
jgi:hypothetical protein